MGWRHVLRGASDVAPGVGAQKCHLVAVHAIATGHALPCIPNTYANRPDATLKAFEVACSGPAEGV
jgi:hypothetical protein